MRASSSNSSTSSPHQRLDLDSELLIDALRGIAALLVFLAHTIDLSVARVHGWDYAGNPELWRWVRAAFGYAGFWVWCFFIISGICIHRSIARAIAAGSFRWHRYALARVTRIYPLFLLGLALAVCAWLLHEDASASPDPAPWRQLTASLLSLHIFTTSFPAYETSWSLSCEMIYYAAWPAALLLARGSVPRAALGAVAGALVALAGIMLLWKGFHKLEHSTAVDGLWTVAVLFPVWICGAWMAEQWGSAWMQISRRMWAASLLLCLASECLLMVLKFRQYPGWALHLTGLSAIPGLMLLLAGARHARLSRHGWARPACRWLGEISYPCYILHLQLLLLVDHGLDAWAPAFIRGQPLIHAVVSFAAVLTILVITGPRLERAFMAWRKRLLNTTQATVPALA